jgi:MFS family permease
MLAGFGNANIGVAQALVADVTDRENRAKGMGIIGAAFGLGFTFGPAIGGLLGQLSPAAPGYGAAVLGAVNFILAWRLLPETYTKRMEVSKEENADHSRKVPLSFEALRRAAATKNVLPILITTLTVIMGFALMEQIMGLYIEHVWIGEGATTAASAKQATALTAGFLVVVGITATIVQGGLIGRLVKKYGELNLCKIGVLILVIAMLATPYLVASKHIVLLLSCAMLYAIGMGLFNPSITSMLSKNVTEADQGGTLGLNQSMASLGRFLGPAFAGMLFERQVNLPFYTSAALIGVSFFLVLRIKK